MTFDWGMRVFGRRRASSVVRRLAAWIWPPRQVLRTARYWFTRLRRMEAPPHRIALGFVVGMVVSFTPLLGFHLFLGAAIAWMLRASILASAVGTLVGNPWTFPAIWWGGYELGHWLMGKEAPHTLGEAAAETASAGRWMGGSMTALVETTVGALIIGILASPAVYVLIKRVATRWAKERATLAAARVSRRAHWRARLLRNAASKGQGLASAGARKATLPASAPAGSMVTAPEKSEVS